MYVEAPRETVCQDVKQRAQNSRSATLEVRPQFGHRAPLCLADRRQRQDDCPIGEIGPCDHILDAIEEIGRAASKHFGVVSVELAHREAAAAREPAESVREPGRQA